MFYFVQAYFVRKNVKENVKSLLLYFSYLVNFLIKNIKKMSKKVSEKMSKRSILTKTYKYHKLSHIEKFSKIASIDNQLKMVLLNLTQNKLYW